MLFGNKSSAVDWLVAGLGNPGQKYQNTRHNMGFLTVDLLAEQKGVKLNKVKFKSAYNFLELGGARCLVMKPQTYMNLSGESVRAAADFYKVEAEDLIVLCDDINLEVGQLRVRPKGSAGGHNGLKNIILHLGTQEFTRIRIGVGEKPEGWDLADYVLGRFTKEENEILRETLGRVSKACEKIIVEGVDSAMNEFNRKKVQ